MGRRWDYKRLAGLMFVRTHKLYKHMWGRQVPRLWQIVSYNYLQSLSLDTSRSEVDERACWFTKYFFVVFVFQQHSVTQVIFMQTCHIFSPVHDIYHLQSPWWFRSLLHEGFTSTIPTATSARLKTISVLQSRTLIYNSMAGVFFLVRHLISETICQRTSRMLTLYVNFDVTF